MVDDLLRKDLKAHNIYFVWQFIGCMKNIAIVSRGYNQEYNR